jgi:hypothetical protein
MRSRLDIQGKEFMFALIWNPSGFYVVERFTNHTKINNAYLVTNLLIPLEQAIFPRGRVPHSKRLVISVGNCQFTQRGSTDWPEKHGIHRIPDQSYSLDLATGDFDLFPTVKSKLGRIQLADEDHFFGCV